MRLRGILVFTLLFLLLGEQVTQGFHITSVEAFEKSEDNLEVGLEQFTSQERFKVKRPRNPNSADLPNPEQLEWVSSILADRTNLSKSRIHLKNRVFRI